MKITGASSGNTNHRLIATALVLALSGAGTAQAVTVFSENFEGYTSFLGQAPLGDPINAGIPKISEGAAEVWYGARFETPDNGTVNQDLAVQKFGGGTNNTHTGRTEDDTGLLFKLNTTNLDAITLSFDWRTFLVSTNDRFVVGYRVGAVPGFGTCTGEGEAGCVATGNLNTSLPWYVNQNEQVNPVLTGNWTQLLRATKSDAWKSESFLLPNAVENKSEVWFALWLDNGEGDYAKIDNVSVTAATPVPEVSQWLMMLAGISVIATRALRR